MKNFLRLLRNLRTSFLFVPSLMVFGGIVLAASLVLADSAGGAEWSERWPFVFGAGAAGARDMLSTIAGSMMAVVGVTFSMTLMMLMLASSQYTSRILRNFMRDRVTQLVLGTFTGIFAYCLIVLRTIRGGDEGPFVPRLSVTLAVVLALVGVGALILFIHHVATVIQASTIIASAAEETLQAIDRLFPETLAEGPDGDEDEAPGKRVPAQPWQAIVSRASGYILAVDPDGLLRLARQQRTIVRMERRVGEFVVEGATLASIAMDTAPERAVVAQLQDCYSLGRHRTLEQDVAFGVRQIVDMALRALSPSSNDTTTAITCVDYLTAILARLAGRRTPSPLQYEDGQLRVIVAGQGFVGLAEEAFDQIRVSAVGNAAVLLRVLRGVETIAGFTSNPVRRRALHRQVQSIAALAVQSIDSLEDRARLEERLALAREVLESAPAVAH